MRQISKRTWLLIVVGTFSALLLLLVDLLKGALAPSLSHLPLWIIAVGIVALVALSIAFGLWQEKLKTAPEMLAAVARENRQIILGRIQNKWITGFLENPLYYSYDEQLLPLPLRERLGSRFDPELSNLLEPTQTIPSGTSIAQVFDRARGELLILGEPGVGKTTLLLELARDLLKRAQENEMAAIPVVLTLSSWAARKLPLEEWIVEELRMEYAIPSQIGKEWVKANQLLLLLDGLDEVAPSALPACINAINEYYHQAHRSLVVCSRTKEFLGQPGRLALHRTEIVQPLSFEQVDSYLDGLTAQEEDVEGLKQVLHQSEELHALATTPLFLTVLILAYHGKPVEELLALVKGAPIDQQYLIFHNYVEQMIQRKGTYIHASAQQTKHWLGWLARQMKAHHQSELFLEQFQPDWLPTRQRAFYRWSFGLAVGVVVGLLVGLAVGVVVGFGVGLDGGLFSGPFSGLISGLIGGLIGLRVGWNTMIEPAEALTWSWKRLRLGVVVGLVGGLVGGLFIGVTVGIYYGLLVGLVGGLVVGLVFGFSRKQLTERFMLSPNEGIRRSIKNGLLVGLVGLVVVLVGWLVYGLVGWLVYGLVGWLVYVLTNGLVVGLLVGLVGGLVGGLGASVQHYTLRFWLWRARCTSAPWRYVAFLDDAVEQLLLRRVGGGYIFRHRLLQDYFASLETPPSKETPATSASLQKPDVIE